MKSILKIKTLFITLAFLTSCSKQSELNEAFNCKTTKLANTKIVSDFNNNFKLSIPITWKTDLYYDKYQSELFSADTTKQLTSTYILDASFNFGKLNFDEIYFKKIDSVLDVLDFQILRSGNIQFQSKPANWYVIKGVKNNFNYHQLNLTVQLSENTYFNAYSDIYGDENIEERICESITIIETIEFLQ